MARTKRPPPEKGQPRVSPWAKTSEPLLWLTGAGHEFINPASNYFYDAALRPDAPHYVLQLTLAGAGYFEARGRRTLLPPGTAFLHAIPGDFRYGYPRERTDTYEQTYVSMTGPDAARWCDRITAAHGHVLTFAEGAREPLAAQMLALARLRAQSAPLDRYLVSAQLYQLLMTVLSALTASRLALRPLAARAVDLIHKRARDRAFTVSALAADLGCTREHLSRAVRAAAGVSPSDYLLQHRLRLAAADLRGSADKLELVARNSGFANANYLCRAFRKRAGVTPGTFRARPWLAGP